MPSVSVVLTSYNHAQYIDEAISSVLEQTFTDFELIIWDDASSDNSWHLIKQYSDPRIKTFRNEEQKRGVWGINKAISEVATGEYIAIHHSDDIWMPEKLEKQVGFLKSNSEYGAVFTDAQAVRDDGSELTDTEHPYCDIFSQPNRSRYEWLNYFLTKGNCLCHPSVLIKKACYEECGLYRYGFAQLGDFDMWVRLCMRYDIHVLESKLVKFRIRDDEGNASADTLTARTRMYTEHYLILKNYMQLTRIEELKGVFQCAEAFCACDEPVPEYVLARAILDASCFALAKLFALEILFDLINDPVKSVLVAQNHQFGPVDFADLTGRIGVANKSVKDDEEERSQNNALSSEVWKLREDVERLAAEKDELVNSLSWRISRPLQQISRLVRRHARGLSQDK